VEGEVRGQFFRWYNPVMTYRGVVKDGVVVVTDGGELPEGQLVEVTPVPLLARVPDATPETDDFPGFGLWKDRTDMGDTSEFSLKLRRSMEERRG
jgi:hypothetical protein